MYPKAPLALLFTDIEGSHRARAALSGVDLGRPCSPTTTRSSAAAIGHEGGFVDGIEGDAFFATFTDAAAGARAAVAALRGLRFPLPGRRSSATLRVRMGLHVGHVQRLATGYVGLEVHRAARVMSAAHGGQLLLTAAAPRWPATTLDGASRLGSTGSRTSRCRGSSSARSSTGAAPRRSHRPGRSTSAGRTCPPAARP